MTSKRDTDTRNDKSRKGLPIVSVILSVACAISLWFYVVSVEDPTYTKTFDGIIVEFKNESVLISEGLSVVSGKGIPISVTVRGRRSDINRYTEDDLSAYVDASSINVPNTYQLRVQTEVPDGLTVTATSSSSIEVYADKTTTKTVPIDQTINIINYKPIGDYDIGTAKIVSDATLRNPAELNIEGAYTVLDTVVGARVKNINLEMSEINEDFNVEVKGQLELYDKNGEVINSNYIKMPGDGLVSLNIPITQRKVFPISVTFEDTTGAGDYNVTYTPAEVEVIGERADIRALGADDFTLVLPGSAEDNKGTNKHILTLPEVAQLTDQSRDTSSLTEIEVKVTVTVKKK